LSERPSGGTSAPDWEIVLSHHLPSRYNRTLAVRAGGRTLHLCARCAGQILGVVAFVALYGGRTLLPIPLFEPSTQLIFAFAPLPAAIDWITQTTGRRESTNSLRVVSGLLLAMALTDSLALLLTEKWTLLLGAALIVGVYLGSLLLVLRATGGWRRVLEEHFPGFESGPG
jgi:uncharacterized membrane protein